MSRTTIVIPCYNEAARLPVARFRSFARLGHVQRFVFVNDGSTDDTPRVLSSLRESDPVRFAILDLPQNRGKAEAVRQGVLAAMQNGPEFVGFWDADLATPLEAIPEFYKVLKNNLQLQIAMGARIRLLGRAIDRRPVRHYLGRAFATAASFVLNLPVYDTQCGAKLFRASAEVRRLFDAPFRTNWIFDVELLARFIRGRKAADLPPARTAIYEVPLSRWRDVAGSKVRATDFAKAVYELALIRWAYCRPGVIGRKRPMPPPPEQPTHRPARRAA